MFHKQQSGFTLIELLILIAFLCVLCGGAVVLYVAFHFIAKFW